MFESDRGGSQQIYVMSAQGGGAKRISFGQGHYSTPVWSPKGDYIAFTKQNAGAFAIGVMKPDGSGERILTEGFHNEGPTWAPNGLFLMFFREFGRFGRRENPYGRRVRPFGVRGGDAGLRVGPGVGGVAGLRRTERSRSHDFRLPPGKFLLGNIFRRTLEWKCCSAWRRRLARGARRNRWTRQARRRLLAVRRFDGSPISVRVNSPLSYRARPRMPRSSQLTVHLPDALKTEVARLAAASNSSSDTIVTEAVAAYLDDRRDYLTAIDEAIAEADQGVFVSGEAVIDWLRSWGTDSVKPAPEPDKTPAA